MPHHAEQGLRSVAGTAKNEGCSTSYLPCASVHRSPFTVRYEDGARPTMSPCTACQRRLSFRCVREGIGRDVPQGTNPDMPTAEEGAPGICKLMNDVRSLGGDAGDDFGEGELVREELADAKDLGGGPVAGGSDAFHGAGLG